MAYADEGISSKRMVSLGIVALLHVLLGYAFVSGLALKAVKVVTGPLETFEVEEQKPPEEEPPPPPPELEEIPPYVPPPEVQIETTAPPPPTISTQTVVQTPEPPRVVVAPPPPAPAPPAVPDTLAVAQGNRSKITPDDYPEASLRAEEEGTVRVRYDVSADGRASNCQIVQSSGHSRLDSRTCELIERRFRFKPATRAGAPVASPGQTQAVRWQIPK